MGGFSLGDLSSVLRLDDSQFHQALIDSAAASALFSVKVQDIGDSVQKLDRELRTAGFGLKEVQGYLNSLRSQGLTTAQSVNVITDSIAKMMDRIQQLRAQGNALKIFPSGLDAAIGRGEVTEPFKKQLDAILARANVEKKLDEDAAKRQREMHERNISQALERERIESQVAAARAKIDQDSTARQREMFDRINGDALAQVRIAKETEDKKLQVIREAQAKERAQYFEHRRMMQVSQAATTVGTTLGVAGAAGLAGGFVVAKDAAQFQDAMAKSLAVIGDISEQMRDKVAASARNAAKETGIAAKTIAEDYAIAAKGGLDVAASLDFVPKAAKFAIATNSELHESTRQVITIMEALQIPSGQAAKVMDELTTANQLARGSVDQLATSLEGKSGAALRSANVSLEEALALTVAFSKAGVTASQSQTFLTQVIERLTYAARQYGNETVQVGEKNMKFHDIVYQADGSVRPFIQTLKLLDEAFKGRSANSIGKFFDDIHLGSARGAQALKILLSQSDVLDILTTKFGTVGGAMSHAFDQQMQSPLRQLDVLKTKLTDIAITLGIPTVAALQSMAGAFKPVLEMLATLAAKFADLPKPLQQTIMMMFGIGAASLVAGGGMLVLSGRVIQMAADLKLLSLTGALGGVAGWITSIAGAAAFATMTIGGLIAAVGTYNKMKSGEFIIGSNGMPGPNPAYVPKQPVPESAKADVAKKGDEIGQAFMDGLRKQLEDLKAVWKDALNPGNFAVNPEAELKKSLKIEAVRQKFVEFSDQYNQIVDKLSAQEQDVISGGAQRLGKMLADGADPRVVVEALQSLEEDLKRFKQEAAQRDKAEATQFARDNAAAQVAAFKERYTADLRAFSDEQKSLLEGGIASLEEGAAKGTSPKQTAEDLKLVELAYKSIQNAIDDTNRTQTKLNETLRKSETLDRRNQKQKRPFDDLVDRVDPRIAQAVAAAGPFVELGTKIEKVMQGVGVTSNFTLGNLAHLFAMAYQEVKQLSTNTDELREVWLKAREAFYRADEGLKPLHDDFVKIRVEMDRIKSQGNITDRIIELTNLQIKTKALDWSTNGLGLTYRDLWNTFSSSFGRIGDILAQSIFEIEHFSDVWKQAIKGIAQALLGTFLQALLKIAASKILIALGVKIDDPQVVATSDNSIQLGINSDATNLNSGAVNRSTTAEDRNTAAVDRLTEAINRMKQGGGQEDGLANFFGGAAIKALTLGQGSVPSYDTGGYISRDTLAMVHAGEYIMTPRITQGFSAMLAGGNGGSGGGHVFDFRNAVFGPKVTANDVRGIMREVVGDLRSAAARTHNGRL